MYMSEDYIRLNQKSHASMTFGCISVTNWSRTGKGSTSMTVDRACVTFSRASTAPPAARM